MTGFLERDGLPVAPGGREAVEHRAGHPVRVDAPGAALFPEGFPLGFDLFVENGLFLNRHLCCSLAVDASLSGHILMPGRERRKTLAAGV